MMTDVMCDVHWMCVMMMCDDDACDVEVMNHEWGVYAWEAVAISKQFWCFNLFFSGKKRGLVPANVVSFYS